ncbi:hypothetical protein SAMN05192555_105178 [Franzmannia pantelleriensis]|uniref:Uncharacterized protein n=1 Tax=Franzmannia pantelleriensis TaxID=48727 RepID=A0A1G9L6N0_9GAMM|nr:hypothetical protein [Halomonas pantelleriensis]SDL57638.1 hypothetical protein SAMN05192555_105178 [Halomonas pantelleriensis]
MLLSSPWTLADGTSATEQTNEGFAALEMIDDQELADLHGREGGFNLVNVQSIQHLDAAVTGASFTAGSIVSGNVVIENRALDNFSGIGLFNINTGHSNAVSTGVNISIYAPTQ